MLVPLFKKIGLKFSLNDPRWGRGSQNDDQHQQQDGKRPADGPPDLDQLWRDFNQRLNRLFGMKSGGGGGDSGGGFKPDMRGAGVGIGIVAVIVVFLWLVSGFFIVQEGQTAVGAGGGRGGRGAPAGGGGRGPGPGRGRGGGGGAQ